MSISLWRLRFTAEIAVDGKQLTGPDQNTLCEAIERTLKQYGYHADFMVGKGGQLEIYQENKNASKR